MSNALEALEEKKQIIRALHAWLESQDIPRNEWGPLLASAAGVEVNRVSKGGPTEVIGIYILTETLKLWAEQGLDNG